MNLSNGVRIKSEEEVGIMTEGGKKLAVVKAHLKKEIKEGVNAYEIDELARRLIISAGGKPSFQMVKGYSWTTCININDGVVHGIPKKSIVFKKGDLISVDLGMYYKGFHTDTSFSMGLLADQEILEFLDVGKLTLKKAINKAKEENRIYDISEAIEKELRSHNLSPIKALVGHGVGKDLHEDPQIPCFINGKRSDSPIIPEGAVLAIEIMYTKGSGDVAIDSDGWTIRTSDGKISGLFEETVAVTKYGPIILTEKY
ncbi:MAG: Methionine aminopeptidase [Candidatus Woesebacteria bacterium GW2011_GWA1_37_7]|uniref:Methionine aminopeptidase n=1 Tax=Candidatus Woesebacteria bacterium GW2011_GWA1_37_7 TaxID=1618545 RepID=A0A0G0K9X4_9BACT|nr:MAG: Methionine aminopeptidase [Candidatus Woesebacteria bacterium GW2011_GWA1_37_7]